MKYACEENLTNFKFWSGAEDRAKALTYNELNKLDYLLPDMFGDDLPSATDINDMFWFEFPEVCHLLGYACKDGEPIREPADFEEDYRLDFLKDYLDEQEWKYTDEQLKALDKKLLDDEIYEIDADEDGLKSLYDTYFTEDDAQAVGIVTDEE